MLAIRPYLIIIVFLSAVLPAASEQSAGNEVSTADKTGTNPLNFQTEFRIFNEYQDLPNSYRNFLNFRYTTPFANRNAALRFTLPVVSTNVGDDSDFGIGDFNFRINYIPKLTPTYGWLAGLETEWNTASSDTLGSGKNTLAPVAVYARFLPGQKIFAPAYQQKFSIGGNDDREDINLGLVDLYYVVIKQTGWIIVDPTIFFDYENNNIASQVEVEFGRIIGPKLGGLSSWYLRPGIGIGAYRVYDWNIEAGYKIVGF